ncbi:MAG: arylsulfatase [Pirellulales bacterium]|nr:arylsulfatase [Pirellulales bacterium]
MHLKHILRFVSCLLVICLSFFSNQATAADRPNIIYILADDLGYGELGCMGQQKILTPHLDQMAAEGLLFTRHYAGGPVCGPSRACLMTGMSQAIGYIKGNPGSDWRKENLRDHDITIPEKLKEVGYETVCFGKWGLGPQGKSGYPTNQGFDRFVGYDTHHAAHNYYPKQLCQNDGKLQLPKGTYSHDVFSRLALEYLQQKKEGPFFLYLPFTIPHSPYNTADLKPYEDKNWPAQYKKYAAMITRMDRDIGRLLELLRESGLAQDTLVIFSSDNGPQSSYESGPNAMTGFFNSSGRLRGIKRDVFEGGVRVPMIAWWPGSIASGGTTNHVSAFQDIMPTFCDLTGAIPPSGIDGISLLPTLRGEENLQPRHEFLYWEFIRMKGNDTHGARQAVLYIPDNVKGVRYGFENPLAVYQLNGDISESKNIGTSCPELTNMLEGHMNDSRTESVLWPRAMLQKGWEPQSHFAR